MTATYVYDDAWEEEVDRLKALEATLDGGTVRNFDAIGVESGWACLEVGAGAGSIAEWLCHRVGPSGRVVAVDQQITFLRGIDHPSLELLAHDFASAPVEENHFDLVHARWLLHWLADPAAALHKMISALRPGGWLLVEEPDFVTLEEAAPASLAHTVKACTRMLKELSGTADSLYGRKLLDDVREGKLVEIQSEGRVPIMQGGDEHAAAGFMRRTLEKVRQPLIESGEVPPAQFDESARLLADPAFHAMFPITVAVWGRKPA